jgi:multidrug resistance efflux pump
MLLSAIALCATAISFIPTPYQVGGEVKLAWREAARQSVYTPIPAIVEQVLVKPGDHVQQGQPMIRLSSREVDREIADVQEKLAQLRQALEQSQQEGVRAQAALTQALAQEKAVRDQANRVVQRAGQLQQGILPPEIQQLYIERQRLQQQLEEVATNVKRFEELHGDGAVPLLRVEEQQSVYRNIQRDLAINAERIELGQRQLQEEADRELGNVRYQAASVNASQMILERNRQMSAQRQAIAALESRLQQLQTQRQALTLTATTTGTVITSDLDLLVGKEVQPENALLQIADLGQLTANVEIKEEDLNFVQKQAPVTFRPRQAKLETYDARVDDILHNVEADETQQKRVATVRVIIDNPEERLRPGSSGYAKIFSEWIPLYERVGREVLKLIPERFL